MVNYKDVFPGQMPDPAIRRQRIHVSDHTIYSRIVIATSTPSEENSHSPVLNTEYDSIISCHKIL